MKTQMFAIYDAKAEAYLPPFFLPNKKMALRAFTDCVNQQGHNFNLHPADYTLFHIAEFDDEFGEVTSVERRALANGIDANREPVEPVTFIKEAKK